MKKLLIIAVAIAPVLGFAQTPTPPKERDLGDKEYIIVKDYKPVLSESNKISDTPTGDTSSTEPPVMQYSIQPKKAETEYETAAIKAVRVKDEQLSKLYRSYVRLGLGNYTAYQGDLYVNTLRNKNGNVALSLNHFSANPTLSDFGPSPYSQNHAGINGKYLFDNSFLSADFDYNRDVVHYYGFKTSDTIIDKSDIRQCYSRLGVNLNYGTNYVSKDRFDHNVQFGFNTISDNYGVSENDVLIGLKGGKMLENFYLSGEASFNAFKKSASETEPLTVYSNLSRNIINFTPMAIFNKDKIHLELGLNLAAENNNDSYLHIYPRINVSLPIAENILYVFGGVNGNLVKNTFNTITRENSFVSASIQPYRNTSNKVELKAGVNGNFSSALSFMAVIKYTTVEDMLLYVNDTVNFQQFNLIYRNGKVLNFHAELGYKIGTKINATLRFDQYNYNIDFSEKAWHRPNSEVALDFKYNVWDKLLLNATIYNRGAFYVRKGTSAAFTADKVKGFTDANLGIEYRYSKILSLFANMNNLGFNRYYYWYNYPTQRFNVVGGLTYSF